MAEPLPYCVSVLCYLFNEDGQMLLLHRRKPPNLHQYSPVGGKLDQAAGESPTACAVREIREETGLVVHPRDLHLTGIVSEAGYGDERHWLMFLYEVIDPVATCGGTFEEGTLCWHDPATIDDLDIPQTDRQIIWPLFWRYRRQFFVVHINCSGGELSWRLEQPAADVTDWSSSG